MKRQPKIRVLLTADPHTTAHFWEVASEMFRGTFVQCEEYEQQTGRNGYIWDADLWDAGKDK